MTVPPRKPVQLAVCREAVDFQPDAVAVAEGRLPVQARLAVYVILAALVSAGAWAWLSRLDRVVSARGVLATQAPSIVVQPLETSIIRAIAVRPGDVVKKGALLATLDPTFAEAEFGQSKERQRFLQAWTGLLKAEIAGSGLPSAAAAADPAEEARLTLFERRKEEYRFNVQAKDLEIATLEDMIAANVKEQARLDGQFKLAAEIEGMYKKLLDQANTSRVEYLGALREKLRVEDLYAGAVERSDQLKERLAKARAERQAFISGWRTDTSSQLVESLQELSEVEHTLAKASRKSELVELTAVSDSIVKEVGPFSAGSVIRQAETLFTLVPVDAQGGVLEAEAAIAAKDIGHIRVGNAVRIKLAAFPFQRHGFLDGEVRMVSPDTFVRDGTNPALAGDGSSGDLFYKCRISLASTRLKDVRADFRLIPGMTLEAEILVGKRRVADYLLDPLLKGLHESLSEP